jgi:nicotinic acetylcholine receptor
MYEMPTWVRKIVCEWMAWGLRMSRPGRDLSRQFLLQKAKMRELEARSPPSLSLISNVKDVDNQIPLNDYPPHGNSNRGYMNNTSSLGHGHSSDIFNNVKSEMLAILNELRFITHKIKEDNEANDEVNDWKFAAMVIDRLCLWVFTVYLVVTTLAIFFSAPNLLSR